MRGVYNPNIYSYFLICGIPPKKMDQVNVYVAGFASQVHSFDILVKSCMHRVAQNKEVKKRRKYKYHCIDIFNRLFS